MIMTAADSVIDGLRREVDAIDDALHELLMQRTELVARIGAHKARGNGEGSEAGADEVFLRPAREAVVLRRLVQRHRGALPRSAIVRIWRELMSALVRLQGPFAVAVLAGEQQAGLWDLARDHFGSLTPMVAHATSGGVLRAVLERQATVGVLPLPQQDEADPWWRQLLDHGPEMSRVFARLPFGAPGAVRSGPAEALAVGLVPSEETGRDRTLFVIDAAAQASRRSLGAALRSASLDVTGLITWRGEPAGRLTLVEVEGFVRPDDARLAGVLRRRSDELRRFWPLGSYPVPFSAAELSGARV